MRRLIFMVIIGLVGAGGSVAMAQEESPSPSGGSEECQVGELCTIVDTQVEEEESGPINDPPGDVRTSLITLSFIAVIVGTYLFFALSGRSLPHLVRMPGRKN